VKIITAYGGVQISLKVGNERQHTRLYLTVKWFSLLKYIVYFYGFRGKTKYYLFILSTVIRLGALYLLRLQVFYGIFSFCCVSILKVTAFYVPLNF